MRSFRRALSRDAAALARSVARRTVRPFTGVAVELRAVDLAAGGRGAGGGGGGGGGVTRAGGLGSAGFGSGFGAGFGSGAGAWAVAATVEAAVAVSEGSPGEAWPAGA